MVALADITPPSDSGVSVTIHGQQVPVTGVSVAGVSMLLRRYPELQDLLTGKDVAFTADRLFEVVPDAVVAVIAAGLGQPGDEKAEKVASTIPVGEQLDIVGKILEVTMPKGIGPFVEQVKRLQLALGTGGSTTAPDSNSRRPAKS